LIFKRSILFLRRNHNRKIDPAHSGGSNRKEAMLKEGTKAPAFCLPAAEQDRVCLKDFTGKWVVLYFYPKDSTSG
jgi:cytochrome oxidase Cu insertion factor (SCO1/SenC/PrrC family)